MLGELRLASLDELIDETIPAQIRVRRPLKLGPGRAERELALELRALARENRLLRSLIGQGYHGTIVPGVIQRNVLENPGWYTQYTPYQAEISQGRLEALLDFQTMVVDLTGLALANASLLDEATAAAEAMSLCAAAQEAPARRVLRLRALPSADDRGARDARRGPRLAGDRRRPPARRRSTAELFGALVQYPDTDGAVLRLRRHFARRVHAAGGLLVVAADLLALTLLRPPGEFGADVAVGSAQRFGVPLGFGGPHAAFLACREEHKRPLPGRIIGVSRDARGRAGAAHGAADARAAHPPRQGDQQHLHGAGAARGDGRHVRRVPRPAGPGRDRRARARHGRGPGAPACAELGCELPREPFFDTLRVAHAAGGGRDPGRAPSSAGSTCAPTPTTRAASASRSTRPSPRRSCGPCSRSSAGARATWRAWPPRLARSLPRAPRAALALPDAPGLQHAPLRARDAALPAAPRGARPVADDLDDPARLVHDEAQRHGRDAAALLAGVRRAAPLRPGRADPGLPPSSSATSSACWPRSPASRRSRCSPTPARRASTPACW